LWWEWFYVRAKGGVVEEELLGTYELESPRSGSINRGTVIIYGAVLESEGLLKKFDPSFIKILPAHGGGGALSLNVSPEGNESYVKQ
jgi:hypothetical protein